ncbi:unnamed protein product [Hermetia illucens]|uniref:Uncharacterized protein n=1 Tax=Hermetia illucens TaxID=343691 RepID=A0A7R8YX94_HERIL|nr:unnamed protein product [Hermetia illucens]
MRNDVDNHMISDIGTGARGNLVRSMNIHDRYQDTLSTVFEKNKIPHLYLQSCLKNKTRILYSLAVTRGSGPWRAVVSGSESENYQIFKRDTSININKSRGVNGVSY